MATIPEQIKFCIKYINRISLDKRKKVAQFIKMKVDGNLITEQTDGSRVRIEQVPDNIINEIYHLLKGQL